MKRLMEEEDAKYQQSELQRAEAAKTILKIWKKYKSKKIRDLALLSRAALR